MSIWELKQKYFKMCTFQCLPYKSFSKKNSDHTPCLICLAILCLFMLTFKWNVCIVQYSDPFFGPLFKIQTSLNFKISLLALHTKILKYHNLFNRIRNVSYFSYSFRNYKTYPNCNICNKILNFRLELFGNIWSL